MKNENIKQIAVSIDLHAQKEISNYYSNRAFARALCSIDSVIGGVSQHVFWLTNKPNLRGISTHPNFTGTNASIISGAKTTLEDDSDGMPIYKNTKLGEILTIASCGEGTYSYTQHLRKKSNTIKIAVYNRAVYSPHHKGVEEIEIQIAGDNRSYRFQYLSDLLELKHIDQERLQEEKGKLRFLKEEQLRISENRVQGGKTSLDQQNVAITEVGVVKDNKHLKELCKQREDELKYHKEIARLERSINDTNNRIKTVKSFLRKSVTLRSQHLLDPYQEEAKRSHVFDDVPIIIEGGPGTGKTTTMIQRLKFLLSKEVLDEYENQLTETQKAYLINGENIHNRWLFFSPTDLLLLYLRANMVEEGLTATSENTRTLPKFRQMIMRSYFLFDPSKDGPFKDYRDFKEEVLIIDPQLALKEFERFCIDYSVKSVKKRINLRTSQYGWHEIAIRIKSICHRYKNISDIDGLMRLFNALHDNERGNVKIIEDNLKDELNSEGVKVKQAIITDIELRDSVQSLFERWRKERRHVIEVDDYDIIDIEDEEELISFTKYEFEVQLFTQIKQLLKQMSLREIDPKIKYSKRNQELLALVEKVITPNIDLSLIGEKAWFVRNFASLCRGISSNFINNIPKMYKVFRGNILANRAKSFVETEKEGVKQLIGIYNCILLDKIIKKDSNKHLHVDEQNLLVGFINNMLLGIYKKSKKRFLELKHKYAKAYQDNVKPVIGIDEATDYSLLDYYFMVSFRHYEFSSITLCGDIMQGLNTNGILSWNDLRRFVMPKLQVKTLNISYRQLPTLLEMAREMYKDNQKVYPAYQSDKSKSEEEPKPLLLVSQDDEEKAVWISNRILDIYHNYQELPSVAIFVGDEVNITEFIERIMDLDILNGIEVVDCSGSNTLQNKEMIRVFRLSEVKGMEFEAVFFYDIDKAVNNQSAQLMRKYLYVGISRATSHLAATMCTDQGQQNITKYFDTKNAEW